MKKIHFKKLYYLLLREQRKSRVLARIAKADLHKRRLGKLRKRNKIDRWWKFNAPEVFQLSSRDSRNEMIYFLRSISIGLSAGKNIELCFDRTRKLHPCGTLIFKAHLDSWRTRFKGSLRLTYPKESLVHELFQHIGLLADFEMSREVEIKSSNVKHWKHFVGNKIEAALYKELTLEVVSHMEHPESYRFGGCLDEAVSNCVNHAYRDFNSNRYVKGNWWMFSSPKEGGLFVAIYDIGIGIPSSLRTKKEWQFLWSRKLSDARSIKAAVETEQSSTEQTHRGKGLPEMLEFCRSLQTGQLVILSGKGGVVYNGDDKEEPKLLEFKAKLPGTLVLWSLPLKASASNESKNHLSLS